MGREQQSTAGPTASLPTFSSSGTVAPQSWLRCSLCGTAHECVIHICDLMRSYRFAQGPRLVDAHAFAHLQSAAEISQRHEYLGTCGHSGALCCAALRRASLRSVVLAAFVLGSTEGDCPLTFFRLDYEMAEMACERAAVVANKTYVRSLSSEDYPGYPAGCYWHTVDGSVYFFIGDAKDTVAKVNSFVRQMCASTPIPAPQYATPATEHGRAAAVAFSTCVREVCYACPSACPPASERDRKHAFCLQTTPTHLPAHPHTPSVHTAIHLGLFSHPSIDPEIRPTIPSFHAALPCLRAARLRCVRAAKCECSTGGSGPRATKRCSSYHHALTRSCYCPCSIC
jgi:hypothetical protein